MKVFAAVLDRTRDFSETRRTLDSAGLEVSWRQEIERWPPALRDEWEERAAILEYDAGRRRPAAEARAYILIWRVHEVEALLRESEAA